ncbi:MAG: winged helix DNA-binding domain-containing protein [Nocardioidaceae bacterium]
MRLSPGQLNRTLWVRQGLTARRTRSVHQVCADLVGLQAQENRSPFLGLAARVDGFDPGDVTRGLESRSLVRMICLRGTIHLLTAEDALSIRGWTLPVQEQERQVAQNLREVRDVSLEEFRPRVRAALAGGPLPVKRLGEALAASYVGASPTALGGLARVAEPLVQVPPRGTWRGSGGVVYDCVDTWVGSPPTEPDPASLVRRYLRAFGPASPADITTWSGVPGTAEVVAAMPDLERHEDERGRVLLDVADGVHEAADAPVPVRLLGIYDNLWLSHAGRDRVTTPEARKEWAGSNGGLACTVFVDGWLTGLWRVEGDRVSDVRLFRTLTRAERAGLDEEVGRVEELLGR